MSSIIGLWLNHIPETIMNNDDSLRELSDVILQGYQAQKMVVAGSALLITMMNNNSLPKSELKSVANDLKNFLDRKRIPTQEVNAITLTSYDDFRKWETIKEQITAAVGSSKEDNSRKGWESKPLEQWSVEDTLQWLPANNLSQYSVAFKENDMDGQTMMDLNEADLRDLGIRSIGHRKTFMRKLTEAKKFSYTAEWDAPKVEKTPPPSQGVSNEEGEFQQPNDHGYNSVIIRGLSESLLEDEDTLFDIENLAFTGFFLDSFKPTDDNGILVTFENTLTIAKKDELKEKFVEVMRSLLLDTQLKGPLTFDFWDDGKIVEIRSESPIVEAKIPKTIEKELEEKKVALPPPPQRMNYWKEFWVKLVTNGDPEDFFDDEESKLNARGSREVLATIRDVKLREIKKDDPGIKYLKGFTQAEIEATLSDCVLDVMYEIENRKPVETATSKEESPVLDKLDHGVFIGMSVEGLPRVITDDDNTVHGIQNIVFKDFPVKHLIVDDKNPPALKVEFEKYITKEKIPQLARNLKNFLKAVNVDQAALKDVTIAFLEDGSQQPPKPAPTQRRRPEHRRTQTNDFLVPPGETEMTRTFMIEGIPERYLNQDSFLNDMPENVFDGVPLENISVPPATMQPDGTMSQTSLEIRFKTALNIQKLPKIAMKLKKFLKRKQIPPRIVNQVTLQVRHEEKETGSSFSELEANPVVGLIFKGIPKKILESNDSLYDMESDVFTNEHPIRLMEPDEADQMLRITIEKPIRKQRDLTTIAQRLKRFLAKQGVRPKAINDVLVMSFNKEKWPQDQPLEKPPTFNPNTYIGIEIENMPASVVDSDRLLEEIESKVFSEQNVVHMNVWNTTLKITFGVAANSKAIEDIARQLKKFLTQLKIPMKQINDIIIEPHTEETWDQP